MRSSASVRRRRSVRLRLKRRLKRHALRRIGYVLHETSNIVVIATLKSSNRKTGRMVQVWILYRQLSPVDAVKSGADRHICFDCTHRGDGFKNRTCYVNLRSAQSIWRAYRRGRYPHLAIQHYAQAFADKKIRLGAYGEPVLIPLSIVRALTRVAQGWTGYTHQWKRPRYQRYRAFVMASCDSPGDAQKALAMGWRYFRVRSATDPLLAGEISCPASDEAGHRTTCQRCLLCNGSHGEDRRKSIGIIVHGSGAKNFVPLTAIQPAA